MIQKFKTIGVPVQLNNEEIQKLIILMVIVGQLGSGDKLRIRTRILCNNKTHKQVGERNTYLKRF